MDWESGFKIVSAAMAGAGGAGTIMYLCAKGLASRIADGMFEKFKAKNQYEFDKLLEEYKAELEGKKYAIQTHFDMEFKTYNDLSGAFYSMIGAVYWLFPREIDYAPA
ncbi:MAG: hypothetical protein ACOYI7_01835 [Candidatus Excrementavichristensenella sp.]|jgi:hypothetical protein